MAFCGDILKFKGKCEYKPTSSISLVPKPSFLSLEVELMLQLFIWTLAQTRVAAGAIVTC